jgi:hypothetical protein
MIKQRLEMFESMVPNTTYGPRIEGRAGEWGEEDYEKHHSISNKCILLLRKGKL